MIRLMVQESTTMSMAQSTKATGRMINNAVTVLKDGLTVLLMKEIISSEESMDVGSLPGLMDPLSLESSMITTSTAPVSMNGPMEESSTENGKIIKWKAMERSLGLMADATLDNTSTI